MNHFKPKFDYCQDNNGRFILSKIAIPSLCLPPKSYVNGPKSYISQENSNVGFYVEINAAKDIGTKTTYDFVENTELTEKTTKLKNENFHLKDENKKLQKKVLLLES